MRLFCKRYLFILFLFSFPHFLQAQKSVPLQLACPLNNAIEHAPERPSFNQGHAELKIILSSSTDSLVKASADVVISIVQRDEDGNWEIVFNHKNYWFWLSGLTSTKVKKDQRLKTGETLGHLITGKKIELLLYDFETPVDPKKFMNCGK